MDYTFLIGGIGALFCLFVKNTGVNRRRICMLLCLVFICQAGLRDYLHTSNDTYNYLRGYRVLLPASLSDVLKGLVFRFNIDDYASRDPGYNLFVKITQLVCPDFRFFLIIVSIIISVPLAWIIYKFTDSVTGIFVAALLYESLFAGFFETGIRQTIAMGMIYISLPYILQKKWLYHYLILAAAYFIHSSAMIFIPFYPLSVMKLSRRFLIWAIILTPVFMFIAPIIVAKLGSGTMFEAYATTTIDNQGTPVFSALLFIVSIGAWIYRKHFSEDNIQDRMMLTGIVCSLVLMPTTWVNSNFIRLVFYYLVFLMPLVPKIIEAVTPYHKERLFISLVVGFILIIL